MYILTVYTNALIELTNLIAQITYLLVNLRLQWALDRKQSVVGDEERNIFHDMEFARDLGGV